jgi:hypothetical protein
VVEQGRRALGSRYELVARLGTGAMGEVWRTLDRGTGQERAAKLLRSEFARDPEIVGRFVQERAILLGLRHPNIVQVHDLVVEGDDLAIVMDLVEGSDLRARLRARGTLPTREAVAVACAVLDALDAAHRAGCLHRDVKPDNVLVAGDGALTVADVRLTDFGIARIAEESTLMATGLLGTPGYMPPELFVHGTAGTAADVYATGILLYELLGGRTPFAGKGTAHTIGNRHVNIEPPPLPTPGPLWAVLARMLAKDPAERLPAAATAAALRALPEEVLSSPALPVQHEPGTWTPAATRVRRADAPPPPPAPGVPTGPGAHERSGEFRTGDAETQEPPAGPVGSPGRRALPPRQGAARRRWQVAGSAAALLALVGGGFWLAALVGSEGDEPAPTGPPVTASVADDPLPSGLTVTRSATYDPAERSVRLTLEYAAQSAPLAGPYLEVVPPAEDGGSCPLVAWQGGDQPRNIPQTTGIDATCGFALEVPRIDRQGRVTLTGEVAVDLGDDPAALESWLEAASAATGRALAETATGAAYPAQRLAGVEVGVPGQARVVDDAVRVVLRPVWAGGEEGDPLSVLYDSEAVGTPSGLLQQVAGGLEGVRLDEQCNGAVTIIGERRVGILRAVPDCVVLAQVGNLPEAASAPFRIAGSGG